MEAPFWHWTLYTEIWTRHLQDASVDITVANNNKCNTSERRQQLSDTADGLLEGTVCWNV